MLKFLRAGVTACMATFSRRASLQARHPLTTSNS